MSVCYHCTVVQHTRVNSKRW